MYVDRNECWEFRMFIGSWIYNENTSLSLCFDAGFVRSYLNENVTSIIQLLYYITALMESFHIASSIFIAISTRKANNSMRTVHIDIGRCGVSANETTLHPNNNLSK